MSEGERVDFVGKILPEFSDCLKELQQIRLKYNVLVDRIKQNGG